MADLRSASAQALRTQDTRTETVSPTAVSPVNLRTTQQQADKKLTSLEGDLQKLGMGLSQTATATHQASEYADKLRSNDAYANYVVGMKQIDKHYQDKLDRGQALTVQDYKEKKDWQNRFYQDMINTSISEGDDTNLTYKNNFINPATDVLMRTNKADTSAQFEVHKKNVLDGVNDVIDKLGATMTPEMIQTQIGSLKAVGFVGAKDIVNKELAISLNNEWTNLYKDGALSPNVKKHLDANGMLTQDGMDEMYNEIYGKFSKRKNGTFIEQTADLTPEAHEMMKKSFANMITAINNGADKIKADTTIADTKTVVDKNYDNMSIDDIQGAIDTTTKQLIETRPYRSGIQFNNDMGHIKDMSVKLGEKRVVTGVFNQLMGIKVNPDGTRENVKPSTLNGVRSTVHTTKADEIYLGALPDGTPITITSASYDMKWNDISSQLDKMLTKEYKNAIKSGNTEQASTISRRLAELRNESGGTEFKEANDVISGDIKSFTINGGEAVSSIVELDNKMASSAEYLKATNEAYTGFMNQRTYNEYTALKESLLKRQEKEGLTDDYVMQQLKTFIRGEQQLNDVKKMKEATDMLGRLNTKYSNDEVQDEIVGGFVHGDTQLAGGVLSLSLDAYNNKVAPADRTEDGFIEYARTMNMVLDETVPYVVGSSNAIMNPTPYTTDKAKSQIRTNMQKVFDKKLELYGYKGEAINILDRDDEKFRVSQFKNADGSIITRVKVLSGLNVVQVVDMNPDEIWYNTVRTDQLQK